MKPRERFLKILNFEKLDDRLPMIEWAAWWDQTIDRWKQEGLPPHLDWDESLKFFNLDPLICIVASGIGAGCPTPASHGSGIITDVKSFESILPWLFTDEAIDAVIQSAVKIKEKHNQGAVIIRLWLDGFFWFPRILFGIERHLFAFYDQPELMHRINDALADFNIRVVDALFPILRPDMVGFAEDMSYNHGPMLSYSLFKEFLLPYYKRVIPHIKKYGVRVLIDSDGDITSMIPWMMEAGIEGVYPLERQAGVDIAHIRNMYPKFLMMGGFDKMVMPLEEDAIRAEFDRILPVMKSGGYIPSVDHQTPPGVSFVNYCIYIRLFEEYCKKAV